MAILHALFWNLLAPAVVSMMSILLANRLGRSGGSAGRARWGIAVGLGAGYLAGHLGILGAMSWPHLALDSKEWVAWFVPLAIVLGAVEACWATPRWASWLMRCVLVAGLIGTVLYSQIENHWKPLQAAVWLALLWLAILASWWNLELQAERLSGPGWVVPVGLVSLGWAVVQVLSNGASLGQLDGVLAATLLGALLTVGLRPGPALSKGAPPVVLIVLAGLGLIGYFYSDVPARAALILVLAPWILWLDRIGFVRRRSYWTRASVRFLAISVTVGVAVFLSGAWPVSNFGDSAGPPTFN
jgi:hypothetical protein